MAYPDDQMLSVPCQVCGNEFQKTLGWLERYRKAECPRCGRVVTVARTELLESRERLETPLDLLRGLLNNMPEQQE